MPDSIAKNRGASARRQRSVVMVGPPPGARGGIGVVLEVYRDSGLFERFNVRCIETSNEGNKWFSLRLALKALLVYLGQLLTGRVALAHIHSSSRLSFYRKSVFVLLARLFRKPVVLHMHGGHFFEFYHDECGRLRRAYVRCVLGRCQCIVMLSERHRRKMAQVVPQVRLEVLPNGCLPVTLDDTRREARHFLFLGRLDRKKGIDDLLQACTGLVARFADLRLTIAGSGELQWVGELVRHHGLADHVELPGWITGADKARLLSRASVFVLPSYFEAQPVSIIEAMAARMPVIATTVGGIPEMVDNGIQGVLYTAGDTEALAAAMAGYCESPALVERHGQAGYQRWQDRYSASVSRAAIEAIYADFSVWPNSPG